MTDINLKALVNKLDPFCYNTLDAAANFCLTQTHHSVEIEHWLIKILEDTTSDLANILKKNNINTDQLRQILYTAISRFQTGNQQTPALSSQLVELINSAWSIASLEFNTNKISAEYIIYALVTSNLIDLLPNDIKEEFVKIPSTELCHKNMPDPTIRLPQQNLTALDRFTINLTEQAKVGKLDAVIGRDNEIRQLVDILTRRRQNNPILVGEAGVGKTAVVEGFTIRIATGDVPPELKNTQIRVLDLALLQAGAGIKGEFENRLKSVIADVKCSEEPIILFIDEAHSLIGAGGQAGQGDAANLLKPALARGELRTIAATTWAEYRKYIEKDAALTRRFQLIKIDEPDEETAIAMLRYMAEKLEHHHCVRILDEAIIAAVRLSKRYIPARQLPDKAVSLLDTACARVHLSQATIPAAIDDRQHKLAQIEANLLRFNRDFLSKESISIKELNAQKIFIEKELVGLNEKWKNELKIYNQLKNIQTEFDKNNNLTKEKINKFKKLKKSLIKYQGTAPLLQFDVNAEIIAQVVESWTGIPAGKVLSSEVESLVHLQQRLEQRVVGQHHALTAIAKSIQVSRANLSDPHKPIGVFLLIGSSGIGKTETALALADIFYGSEQALTVINMSEYKEEHKISLLTGSPPGYVGYGEGGVLTEAVRRRPYSVILLDEIEKAHPNIQDVFYQVFDKGMLMDGEGRWIDFTNTIIIMTSNACSQSITKLCQHAEARNTDKLIAAIRPELLTTFKPAFLGRVTVIPYFNLNHDMLHTIADLQLNKIKKRVALHYNAKVNFDNTLKEYIVNHCHEADSGARNITHILNQQLLPLLSAEILEKVSAGVKINSVNLSLGDHKKYRVEINH